MITINFIPENIERVNFKKVSFGTLESVTFEERHSLHEWQEKLAKRIISKHAQIPERVVELLWEGQEINLAHTILEEKMISKIIR